MKICRSSKVAPTDQQLLLLARSLASGWVNNLLGLLNECDPANEAEKHNTLSLLYDFSHLEKHVRAHSMPNIESNKQEQFIFSLEQHWLCELQQLTGQMDMKPVSMASSHPN